MKISYTALNKRLEDVRLEFSKKVDFQREVEEKIKFILSSPWLKDHKTAAFSCYTTTLFVKELHISVSNVDIESFIENVLGPYHLKYDIKWRMELSGNEEDPVFIFRDNKYAYTSDITIEVKEGEFKVCTFHEEVIGFRKATEATPITRLRMVCE